MIERLNFYDVYGYLLPGVGLLGIIWLPFWIVTRYELPAALSSAIAILFVGYVAGHAVARVNVMAFPHGRVEPAQPARNGAPARPERRRSPSDFLLDNTDPSIAPDTKSGIIETIRRRFGIRTEDQAGQEAEVDRRRRTAFILCRRALLQHEVGSYAEQFEGLYALMRGWLTVAWLSAAYDVGWAIAPWMPVTLASIRIPEPCRALLRPDLVAGALLAGLGVAFIAVSVRDYRRERNVRRQQSQPTQYDPWPFRLLAFSMVPLGALLSLKNSPDGIASWDTTSVLVGAAVVSWLTGLRFHSAYHYFARLFALHVYQDFYVLERYGATPLVKASELS